MANDSGSYDEATRARRFAMAQALLAPNKQPITHWAQGLSELGEGLLGGYQFADLKNEAAKEKHDSAAELAKYFGQAAPAAPEQAGGFQKLASLFNSGGSAPAMPAGQQIASAFGATGVQPSAPAPQTAQPMGNLPAMPPPVSGSAAPAVSVDTSGPSPLDGAQWPAGPVGAPNSKYGSAIASIESGGKYDKLGPMTGGDRAYGKYQVMGNNIPEWSRAALGQELTPQQFLASPEAQEAVFNHRFGQYVDKYGPEGASKAWFAGEKGMNNPNAKDVLGTSVASYGSKFMNALGDAPASQAISQALQGGASGAPTTAAPVQVAQAGQPSAEIYRLLSSKNPTLKAIGGAMLQQQMKPSEFGFQSQPDGTILRTNPRTGTVEPIYQGATKPTFGVVGKDADGKETYGFIDAAKGKITPVDSPKGATEGDTITGPDGKQIPIPAGVDRKTFKNEISKTVADAATGKKTEVQGAAEQFANRLETAEKNFSGLEKEASGVSGATQTVAGKIPVVGSALQGANFQKMEQAKSQFITALLRKESGAAIGKEEFTRYDKEFFPQPGDKPEVVAQKAEARRVAIDAMKKTAGPGYKSPTETLKQRTTKSIGGKNYYQENGQWFEE